jgi:hypothetical protein
LLSQSEEEVLSLGLSFSIRKKKHKELIVEAGINAEQGLNEIDIDEQDMDHIRLGVSKILKSKLNNPDPRTPLYAWTEQEIKSHREDSSIIICLADKGNVTITMNINDLYESLIPKSLKLPKYYALPQITIRTFRCVLLWISSTHQHTNSRLF